jgi:hypothetical protein
VYVEGEEKLSAKRKAEPMEFWPAFSWNGFVLIVSSFARHSALKNALISERGRGLGSDRGEEEEDDTIR